MICSFPSKTLWAILSQIHFSANITLNIPKLHLIFFNIFFFCYKNQQSSDLWHFLPQYFHFVVCLLSIWNSPFSSIFSVSLYIHLNLSFTLPAVFPKSEIHSSTHPIQYLLQCHNLLEDFTQYIAINLYLISYDQRLLR